MTPGRAVDARPPGIDPLDAPGLPSRVGLPARDALWSRYTRGPAGGGLNSSSAATRLVPSRCLDSICGRKRLASSVVSSTNASEVPGNSFPGHFAFRGRVGLRIPRGCEVPPGAGGALQAERAPLGPGPVLGTLRNLNTHTAFAQVRGTIGPIADRAGSTKVDQLWLTCGEEEEAARWQACGESPAGPGRAAAGAHLRARTGAG